ncbi:hypothetical protein KC19_VG291000 [Ceratodon purpureus]|uniref:Uncharacterized protein n=1 Tax=Ceratodon purpureus TaxID=3225 RepID=A0A8T0HUW5_CERPU|nr:hypothetical protein KC19_VG291000 [Ceratodon purpureus]
MRLSRSHSCTLKVTAEGTMVSPLDLAHHKPYECLLLGYLPSKGGLSSEEENVPSLDSRGRVDLPDKYVLMSIPGDHSRKPPLKCIQCSNISNLLVFCFNDSLSSINLFNDGCYSFVALSS